MRKPRNRSPWRAFFLLGVLLVMGLLTWIFIGKARERKEFVSKVDPATGYRCRFTIGAGWKHTREDRRFMGNGDFGNPPDRFLSAPSNTLLQWITVHLLHRSQSPSEPAEISLFVQATSSQNEVALQDGYPAVPPVTPPLSEHHLIIDDCRATLETYPYPGTSTAHETDLLICTPDRKAVFQLIAYSAMQGDGTDREMQEIIRSFHIEKVPGPDSKR